MTQDNTLNVILSNSRINKLKFELKDGVKVTFKLSSNLFGHSNDKKNSLHKFLITNTQVLRLRKAFCKWLIS